MAAPLRDREPRPGVRPETHRALGCWLCAAALLLTATAALGAPPSGLRAGPRGAQALGAVQRLDINRISLPVSNSGSFPWDVETGGAGLEYPRGSGQHAMFAAGLWLSARVAEAPRATVTGYYDEFAPGAVLGGASDDPARPEYRVYRLDRHYPSTAARDAALADYVAGAVSHGAQGVAVLPDGSLDIAGDAMCWAVYNDLDAARHLSPAGSTPPLGVEVQQTTFAFDRPGALGSTVYVRFRILNRGLEPLSDLHVGLWADPDIGDDTDDLAAADAARGMGYCYNGSASDLVYGSAPPALGIDVVGGPVDPANHRPRSMTAFSHFVATDEPVSAGETCNVMHGLEVWGAPMLDPTTFTATPWRHPGDPVFRTGWLDNAAGDKRVLVSSGPAALLPGEQMDVVFAIIVAQGADPLGSVSLLRSYDDQAQAAYDGGSTIRLAADTPLPRGLALERPSPNPVRGALAVTLSLPDAAPAVLELLDVAGRIVARHDAGALGAGRHTVRLTSTPPAPGLYLVRLARGGHVLTAKVLVVR